MAANSKPLTGPDDPRHGTLNGYNTHRCRCDLCASASREANARYRANNREKLRERAVRYRAENAETIREREARRRVDDAEKISEQRRSRRAANPEAFREREARYYAENAEKIRESGRRYYAENAETLRERSSRYRTENPEKVREQKARYYAENAETLREYNARYRTENAETVREWEARYRATPEGRAVSRAANRRRRERVRLRYCGCDTRENLHAVWVMDEGLCAYCGAEGTDYEHVVPLAGGGWGCISNFRIACKSCNSRKGTKPLSVFLDRLAASGTPIRPGATNSGLPCPAAAARMAARMLPAGSA